MKSRTHGTFLSDNADGEHHAESLSSAAATQPTLEVIIKSVTVNHLVCLGFVDRRQAWIDEIS